MKKILISGPVLSRSGYGEMARFALRSLNNIPEVDLYLLPTTWGNTGWLHENNEERSLIDSLVLKTQKTKKLSATKGGIDMGFGIVSKITVDKNHLTNTAHSGEFVITADKIIPNEPSAIKDYKDTHKQQWGEELEIKDIK